MLLILFVHMILSGNESNISKTNSEDFMTKQELIEQGFKYIATQNCEQKTEVWAKFTGYEDMIQYWYYFPETDQTNPGNVNTVSFVGQLGLFSIMQDKMRMDFLNKSVKYDKSCIWDTSWESVCQ